MTATNSGELLPCPFCGQQPTFSHGVYYCDRECYGRGGVLPGVWECRRCEHGTDKRTLCFHCTREKETQIHSCNASIIEDLQATIYRLEHANNYQADRLREQEEKIERLLEQNRGFSGVCTIHGNVPSCLPCALEYGELLTKCMELEKKLEAARTAGFIQEEGDPDRWNLRDAGDSQ